VPPARAQESNLKRDDWMLLEPTVTSSDIAETRSRFPPGTNTIPRDINSPSVGEPSALASKDFFSDLGTERKRKPRPDAPDPEKVHLPSLMFVSMQLTFYEG
jgi:hypothetical protein